MCANARLQPGKIRMLTRAQRMKSVPGLIDLAQDDSLNTTARTWVYQALREITTNPYPTMQEPGAVGTRSP
jgi:hypothetical protein